MPRFIKSSEGLEHNHLGKSERWCSGSPRKSLSEVLDGSQVSRGPEGRGALQPRAALSPGDHRDGGGRGTQAQDGALAEPLDLDR